MKPDCFERLAGTATLAALVSMDLEPDEAARVAATQISRWRAVLHHDPLFSLTLGTNSHSWGNGGRVPLRELFEPPRWETVESHLRIGVNIAGDTEGFAFSPSHFESSSHPALPTLALWFNAASSSSEALEAAEKLADTLMDEAMAHHRGIQALTTRWSWKWLTLDSTPYEDACGVYAEFRLGRAWLTRFVRGIGVGRLWLGTELASRIASMEVLQSACRMTQLGTATKLYVETLDQLPAVEHALASMLPSGADCEALVAATAR